MPTPIDELRQQLAAKNLSFSHIAVKTNGETVYLVNDVFVSPAEADRVARGMDSIEALRNRGELQSEPIAFFAEAASITPLVKAIYDVSKDGWEKLKSSRDVIVDILDSRFEEQKHVVSLSVTNLSRSGIYLDSVSIAKIVDESDKYSLNQATVTFVPHESSTFGESDKPAASVLPYLLTPGSSKKFLMPCPPLLHKGVPRTYGVAELHYSKLDEPGSDHVSFTFRLR